MKVPSLVNESASAYRYKCNQAIIVRMVLDVVQNGIMEDVVNGKGEAYAKHPPLKCLRHLHTRLPKV